MFTTTFNIFLALFYRMIYVNVSYLNNINTNHLRYTDWLQTNAVKDKICACERF